MKMSNFIIGVVLASLVLTVFFGAFSSMSGDYGVTLSSDDQAEYSNWTAVFDQTNAIQEEINTVQNETFSINPTGLADILGGFVASSVSALKTAWQSFGIFTMIFFKIAEILNIPAVIVTALITILVIMIVIGVIISTMIKRDS